MLETVTIEPEVKVSGTVIWMHGLGADGFDFHPIVPKLERPDLRFVFPHAPLRAVSINMGVVMRAWYDVVPAKSGRQREPRDQVAASARSIRDLIRRELLRGLSAKQIVLAGFSQGAAMALHVGTSFEEALGGIIALSGYQVSGELKAHQANRATPIYMAHGDSDEVVPIEKGKKTFEKVRAGRKAVWEEYPMGHEVCLPQIESIRNWLLDTVPSSGSAQSDA